MWGEKKLRVLIAINTLERCYGYAPYRDILRITDIQREALSSYLSYFLKKGLVKRVYPAVYKLTAKGKKVVKDAFSNP